MKYCCCRATTALSSLPLYVASLTDGGNADILLLRDCYVSHLPEGGEKTLRPLLSQSHRFTGCSFSLRPVCHTSEAERIHFPPFFCSLNVSLARSQCEREPPFSLAG